MHPLDQQLQANIRGDFAEGWRLSEMMWREDPSDNRVAFNRGWHLLAQGDLQGGMELIDRGRWINVFGSSPLQSIKPIYNPAQHDLSGKTVLLRNEGGLGDEIINVRFASYFSERGAKVVVSGNSGLASLFARMPSVSAVVQSGLELGAYHDYWVPGMSAVRVGGYSYETLSGKPYLLPDPERVKRWASVAASPHFKIGIRWSGNPQFEHEQNRRFPVEPLIALSDMPGTKFFSFQRDSDMRTLPEKITDLSLFLADWEDTAAALSCMDLVITSCTSVAHLAAALGKETWIIVPILPYYIWAFPGEKSPWYDSVRLFRQTTFGDWQDPFFRLQAAVLQKLTHASFNTAPYTR